MRLMQDAVEPGEEVTTVRRDGFLEDANSHERSIHLLKYQTLGNSYLVFDPIRNESRDLPSPTWIRMICDGNYGIGSNGLLVGPNNANGTAFEFQIFNSDGSQAELSGNGSRIFARYLMDAGYVALAERGNFSIVAVSSDQRRIMVDVSAQPSRGAEIFTAIKIVPSFGAHAVGALDGAVWSNGNSYAVAALADIGRRKGQGGTAWSDSTLVSIGNPHCVTFVSSADLLPSFQFLKQQKDELSLVADAPSSGSINPVFIDGCNLQWCFVESRRRIHLRIVERGEGPTLASGSSASAATIAAFKRGLIDRQVTVVMPGGSLTVTLLFHGNDIASVGLAGVACRLAEIKMDSFANVELSDRERS